MPAAYKLYLNLHFQALKKASLLAMIVTPLCAYREMCYNNTRLPHIHKAINSNPLYIVFSACCVFCNYPVDGKGHMPGRHQQPQNQDEVSRATAEDEVQHEQGGAAAQGAAARYDPKARPLDDERQAAEYPEPEKLQLSILYADGFENAVQQPGDGNGQNCLFETTVMALALAICATSIRIFWNSCNIQTSPEAFQKRGKAYNRPCSGFPIWQNRILKKEFQRPS